jgi:hypothetical protein
MGLEELRRIIAASDRGDWNVVSCFGMPSFLPWSPDGEFSEHHARAAYRPDVSLGLAWGIRQNEDFQEDWTQEFPDSHAESFLADILYAGMLVAREHLVVVDGGRTYLPIPDQNLTVTQWDHDFAKLLDELQLSVGVGGGLGDRDRSEFESYFRRVGFSVAE